MLNDETHYTCISNAAIDANAVTQSQSLSQDNRGVTQPTEYQLASIYMKSQSNNKYKRESMKAYLTFDEGEDRIDELDYILNPHDPYYNPDQSDLNKNEIEQESMLLPELHGSQELKTRLKQLCIKYKDIFSTKLQKEPADVPPFEIHCDKPEIWASNKNRLPPRIQTASKQEETIRQINDMLENKVIQKSDATSYSQVLLVPKPNNRWRFTVDYRILNDCCKPSSWPLPNIKLTMQRLGTKIPKINIFGKIDCTSGYSQTPLSKESRHLTAFICILGVYEYLRTPMGPKGSASYFQQIMATVVLIGLVYVCCEVYLDDILIYASNEDDFLKNCEIIFQRFRKNIM